MEEKKTREQLEQENMEQSEVMKLLVNVQNNYTESNKIKDKIIVLLIVLMFLEAVAGYAGFLWWESQWEYTESVTTEVYTEGDNANAEYNDVEGDQYNDNATHNETIKGDE